MDIVVDTVENNRIDVPRKNQSQASFLNFLYGVIECNKLIISWKRDSLEQREARTAP